MDVKDWRKYPTQVISSLEDTKTPFANYILTYFFAVMIREFLECYSQTKNVFDFPPVYIAQNYYHYTLYYITLTMLFGILMHYATSSTISKVFRVLLPSSILLLLAPLLDLLLTRGKGSDLFYLQPGLNIDMWRTYYTFGDKFAGMSTAMRIEQLYILICIFSYFRLKACSIFRSLVFTWGAYNLIFIIGSSPFIVQFALEMVGSTYVFSSILLIRYYLVILFFLSIWVAYLADRNFCITIIKKIGAGPLAYAELSLLFGAAIAMSIQKYNVSAVVQMNPQAVIGIILSMMSISFACLFVAMTRINYDEDAKFRMTAYASLALALFYASFVNGKVVLIVAVIMGSGYLYLAMPLCLKRVPVFSKIVVSLGSFALVLLGFLLIQRTTISFPNQLLWIYFIGMTVAANFIDLESNSTDQSAGVVKLSKVLWLCDASLLAMIIYLIFY